MALTLHYDFANSPSLAAQVGPTLSITRATTATMKDADGYIREVQSGEPRFTGAAFAHNLITRSNDLDTTWVLTNATIAQNATDPNGVANNAWTLTDDATSGVHTVHYANAPIDTEKDRVFSIHVKAGTARYVCFASRLPNTANTQWNSIFDTTTGAFVLEGTQYLTHNVESLSNDWYRISIEDSVDSSAYDNLYVGIADGPLITDTEYSGSGDTIFLYGGQYEQLNPNTSHGTYVPTTTAAVTSLSGTNTGLLVEEARTNICLQSEDFSTTWATSSSLVNANATTSPDGSTTADEIEGTGGGSGAVAMTQAVTVATSTQYVYSVFAKKDALDWVAVSTLNFTTPANAWSYFDLTNGVVGTKDAGHDDYGIEDFGNGWYRCWVSFTTDAADIGGTLAVYVAEADLDITILKDNTSSIFVWGAQLEAGAFPTSYIPTVASSVTRNTWYNNDAGSFYTQVIPGAGLASTAYLLNIDGTTLSAGSRLRSTGNVECPYFSDGVHGTATVSSAASANTSFRDVFGYAQDDLHHVIDGGTPATDSTMDIDTTGADTGLGIGATYAGGSPITGHISEIRYYNERLDNETLLNMSNGIFPSGLAFVNDLTRDLVRGLVSNLVR
jgi:hypothetical protein